MREPWFRSAFLGVLDGSCKTPVGAHACLEAGHVDFHAIVLKPDGSRFFETAASGPVTEAARLGEAARKDLAAQIPARFLIPRAYFKSLALILRSRRSLRLRMAARFLRAYFKRFALILRSPRSGRLEGCAGRCSRGALALRDGLSGPLRARA